MNAVKYRIVSGVVWTNRTMASSNTDTNRTGVLGVGDIGRSEVSVEQRRNVRAEENGTFTSKPADRRHRPARLPHAIIRGRSLRESKPDTEVNKWWRVSRSQVKHAKKNCVTGQQYGDTPFTNQLLGTRASLVTCPPPSRPANRKHFSAHRTLIKKNSLVLRKIAGKSSHQGEPDSIPGRITPDFRKWGSWRTIPLVGGFFLGDLPFPPPLHSGVAPHSHRFTLIGSLKTSLSRAAQISSLTHVMHGVIFQRFDSTSVRMTKRDYSYSVASTSVPSAHSTDVIYPASFPHWLLPRCEVTPFLSELCVIGANDCRDVIYWHRVTRGVTYKVRSNDKRIAKRHAKFALLLVIRLSSTVLCMPEPASFLHWLLHRCEDTPFLTELHVIGAHTCDLKNHRVDDTQIRNKLDSQPSVERVICQSVRWSPQPKFTETFDEHGTFYLIGRAKTLEVMDLEFDWLPWYTETFPIGRGCPLASAHSGGCFKLCILKYSVIWGRVITLAAKLQRSCPDVGLLLFQYDSHKRSGKDFRILQELYSSVTISFLTTKVFLVHLRNRTDVLAAKAVQFWDTEIGCAQPALSVYFVFGLETRRVPPARHAHALWERDASSWPGGRSRTQPRLAEHATGGLAPPGDSPRSPVAEECASSAVRYGITRGSSPPGVHSAAGNHSRREGKQSLSTRTPHAAAIASHTQSRASEKCEVTDKRIKLERRCVHVVRLLAYPHGRNLVRFEAVSPPDVRMWGGFSRGTSVSPAIAFRRLLHALLPSSSSVDTCQIRLGSQLVDDRPIMNAVKYRVVSRVVWTNRTMVSSNTDTNRTGVLAVVDIGDSLLIESEPKLLKSEWSGHLRKRIAMQTECVLTALESTICSDKLFAKESLGSICGTTNSFHSFHHVIEVRFWFVLTASARIKKAQCLSYSILSGSVKCGTTPAANGGMTTAEPAYLGGCTPVFTVTYIVTMEVIDDGVAIAYLLHVYQVKPMSRVGLILTAHAQTDCLPVEDKSSSSQLNLEFSHWDRTWYTTSPSRLRFNNSNVHSYILPCSQSPVVDSRIHPLKRCRTALTLAPKLELPPVTNLLRNWTKTTVCKLLEHPLKRYRTALTLAPKLELPPVTNLFRNWTKTTVCKLLEHPLKRCRTALTLAPKLELPPVTNLLRNWTKTTVCNLLEHPMTRPLIHLKLTVISASDDSQIRN
ncbi:hypothetical protein PR048_033474 [Dryococelus australis]|uniref:Uncharacterized protein n=1 Tax=Dryococelus australis TaxID=614101 RepID=A0ABQ9G4J1_9NEOP|nr:hypothetical protein PR048_033474 [Dryococelus australis]